MSRKIIFSGYIPGEKKDEECREEWPFFCVNLGLLLVCREEIYEREEFFYCQMAYAFLSMAYLSPDGPLPLGALLKTWEEGYLLDKCDKCGGTVYIAGAGGSPLTNIHRWWGCCPNCQEERRGKKEKFQELWKPMVRIKKKYPNKPIIEKGDEWRYSYKDGAIEPKKKDRLIKPAVEGVSLQKLVQELQRMKEGY